MNLNYIFSIFIFIALAFFPAKAQVEMPDSIVISVVHGFRIKKEFRKAYKALPGMEYKTVGGLKGGHVEVHLDTLIYGFTDRPQAKIPHLFSHNKKRNNGLFQKKTTKEWLKANQNSKVTFITIPISKEQLMQLKQNYEDHIQSCPYDFALFGMRCASSVYDMLNNIGTLAPLSRSRTVMKIFHPRAFRKVVIPWALKKGYPVKIQEGIAEKKWDK